MISHDGTVTWCRVLIVQHKQGEGRAADLEYAKSHGLAQSRNLVNVLDDFIMQAIAGLASYKCNLVPKDICRLRMQDCQFAVAVFKSWS